MIEPGLRRLKVVPRLEGRLRRPVEKPHPLVRGQRKGKGQHEECEERFTHENYLQFSLRGGFYAQSAREAVITRSRRDAEGLAVFLRVSASPRETGSTASSPPPSPAMDRLPLRWRLLDRPARGHSRRRRRGLRPGGSAVALR